MEKRTGQPTILRTLAIPGVCSASWKIGLNRLYFLQASGENDRLTNHTAYMIPICEVLETFDRVKTILHNIL